MTQPSVVRAHGSRQEPDLEASLPDLTRERLAAPRKAWDMGSEEQLPVGPARESTDVSGTCRALLSKILRRNARYPSPLSPFDSAPGLPGRCARQPSTWAFQRTKKRRRTKSL